MLLITLQAQVESQRRLTAIVYQGTQKQMTEQVGGSTGSQKIAALLRRGQLLCRSMINWRWGSSPLSRQRSIEKTSS
eukprot:22799_4